MTNLDEINILIDLRECRLKITEYIASVAVDERVVNCLLRNDVFVPKECELWDYKEAADQNNKLALAKTIKQIVAFHNSFGGYLLYGVKESEDNRLFVPVGVDVTQFDVEQLRSNLGNYTGKNIDITLLPVDVDIDGIKFTFEILHIPKRTDSAPVSFVKDGPQISGRHNPIFSEGNIFYRDGDKVVLSGGSQEEWIFLVGSRINPMATTTSIPNLPLASEEYLENNLPDRSFICPHFIGRDALLNRLWSWLADDLSRTKLLAGDGGKGKTSIAYTFASAVCRNKPSGYELVVWLTAKKQQFIGINNEYVQMPETHFIDATSMLKELCQCLTAKHDEVATLEQHGLRRLLKSCLELHPALVILDDLDSLSIEQQKSVMEIAYQMSGTPSKILMTSRKNYLSPDAAIPIPGFSEDEYPQYVKSLSERLALNIPTASQVARLWKASDGSPLFTESIFRLIRNGVPIDKAINDWRNQAGDIVRQAALKREIDALSNESRRVLFILARMGSASNAELRQISGLLDGQVVDCIEELTQQFLVSAPNIIQSVPRFSISSNTSNLVLEHAKELVKDHKSLEDKVRKISNTNASLAASIKRDGAVGIVINQAMALLKDNRYEDAIKTTDAGLQSHKGNGDLLLLKGRCMKSYGDVGKRDDLIRDARIWFRKAYEAGCRKEMLYSYWYDCEMSSTNPGGALEVAVMALEDRDQSASFWRPRAAVASWNLSKMYREAMNLHAAYDEMLKTCRFYEQMRGRGIHSDRESVQQNQQYAVALSEAWSLEFKIAQYPKDFYDAYVLARKGLETGCYISEFYGKMMESLDAYVNSHEKGGQLTPTNSARIAPMIEAMERLSVNVYPLISMRDAMSLGESLAHLKKKLLAVIV
jgi:tetratricopeptide (TPR) repeat protein